MYVILTLKFKTQNLCELQSFYVTRLFVLLRANNILKMSKMSYLVFKGKSLRLKNLKLTFTKAHVFKRPPFLTYCEKDNMLIFCIF